MTRGLLALVLAMLLPSAAMADPWEEVMGHKPRLWTDPAGRFSIDLPAGWKPEPRSDQGPVDFWRTDPDHGQRALVTVEIRPLPPGVKLSHFAVRVGEEIGKVAKNVDLVEEDRIQVSGQAALRRLFTHQERGNAELTNEVVQVVFVIGERGYVITLETASGARALFWEEFNTMIKGFTAVGSGDVLPERKPGEGRRKVRAGEMVNPNAVPY